MKWSCAVWCWQGCQVCFGKVAKSWGLLAILPRDFRLPKLWLWAVCDLTAPRRCSLWVDAVEKCGFAWRCGLPTEMRRRLLQHLRCIDFDANWTDPIVSD